MSVVEKKKSIFLFVVCAFCVDFFISVMEMKSNLKFFLSHIMKTYTKVGDEAEETFHTKFWGLVSLDAYIFINVFEEQF